MAPPTSAPGDSPRRSARLASVSQQENTKKVQYRETDSLGVVTTNLWCNDKDNPLERDVFFASRTNADARHFKPGMVIWAPQHVHQTDLKARYPDNCVQGTICGPVHTKKRPMVVLWATHRSILALQMSTVASELKHLPDERKREYVSMIGHDYNWNGETPWCKVLKWVHAPEHRKWYPEASKKGFVDVAHPIRLEFVTPMDLTPGRLTPESYKELIKYYEFRNQQAKKRAFKELEQGLPTPIKTPGIPVKGGTRVVDSEGFEKIVTAKEAQEQLEKYETLLGPVPITVGPAPKKRKTG